MKTWPAYRVHDFASCWVEDSDFSLPKGGASMKLITDAQNSLYHTRDKWWNGGIQGDVSGIIDTLSYQGQNEVSVSADMDDINKYTPEALVIVLPTTLDSICDLDDKGLAQSIDDQLYTYWSDPKGGGYRVVPVVTMKTIDIGKEIFASSFTAQEFTFESGHCIKKVPGGSEALYYADGAAKGVCY